MLMMLLGVGGNLWAEEVTFTPGKDTGETSVTKNGVTATMTTMNNASYYQIYANQSATFTISHGTITKIEFNCTAKGTSKYGPGNASANVGSYTYSGTVGTWSGSATSVTISSTAQVRMTSLTITYTPSATGPVDPDVSFASDPLSLEVGEEKTNPITKPSDLTVSYSSDDESVATVDVNGQVTGVGVGETTITASWVAVANTYNAGSESYTVNVTAATPSTTYVKVTNANQLVVGNEYILVAPNYNVAMGAQGTNLRAYVDVTVSDDNKVIIKQQPVAVLTLGGTTDEWTFLASDNGLYLALTSASNGLQTSEAVSANAKWTITEDFQVYSKSYSDYHIQYYNGSGAAFKCYKSDQKEAYLFVKEGYAIDNKENASVSIDVTSLTVGGETAQITAVPEGLVMSYESSAPSIASVENGVVTGLGHGSATITVSWDEQEVGGKTYNAGSREFEIFVVDPNAPGTQNNPYTVAQARAAIDAGTGVTGVYATGIVCKASNNLYSNKYLSYYISDDGLTESLQLEAYNGLGLEGANFKSKDDILVGDKVVIYGNLTKYGETYEFAEGNILITLNRPEKPEAGLAYATTEITAERGGVFTAPELTNPNNLNVTYSSSNEAVATVDAETGAVTLLKAGETTITATFDGNSDYKPGSASYTLTVTVPSHTATFFVNGQQTGEGLSVAEDAAITFPETPADIEGKTFVGWVTEAIDGETDEAPTFVTSATMGTADVTYYAVFASQEGSGVPASLTKMTSNDTFATGDKVVIVANGDIAMYQETISNSYVNKYTYDNNVATVAANDKNWLSVSGSTAGTWKLGDDANGYVYNSSSNNLAISTENSTDFTLAWDEIESKFTLVGNNRWLSYRSDLDNNKYFRMGGRTSDDKASGDIYFDIYKYNEANIAYSGYCTTVIKPVAKIGNKGFETLQAAVDAAEAGQTIDIVDDFTLTTVTTSPSDKYNVNVNKSVTINGNNHVITSAEGKRAIVLEGEGLDVTIKDLTVKSNKAEACLWIASNLTCTLDNTVLDGTNGKTYNQPLTIGSISEEGRVTLNVTNGSVIKTNDAGTAHYAIIAWHPADITVTDSKLIGWANVYLKPDAAGSTVKIEGSEMKSHGLSGNSNNFSILVTEGGNNTIEVKDTKITSSAVEGTYQSLITLGGEGNVVKLLGETTYETNDKTWGAITYNWGSLMNNKLYLDDTTKAAFAEYLDGSHQETIEPADETGLYPVNYVSEIHYYWAVEGGYDGGYYSFADPFKNGWLADGEFIALQKDITLTEDITCQLASGTSFNFLLGDFTADKNGHSVSLADGVKVITDKQTDIFSAATEGSSVYEEKTETGYIYTVGNYVARCNGVYFATLQAAVDAAEAGQTIDIVDDFTLTTVTTSPSDKYNVNVNKSVTINGNNHVITSAEGKRAIVLEGEGLDVTIKDLTVKSNKAEACLWIASNLTCTLDNTVLDGTNGKTYNQPLTIGSISEEGRVTLNVTNGSVIKTNDAGTAHYAIIAWHPADITVTDSKLIGWANVYLKPDAAGSTVKIEGSEMKSHGLSGNSNNFSILVTEGGNNTIEVKDTKITSSAVEGTYQSLITLGGEGNVVKLLGETTYETNDKTWGAITYNWGSLMNNKLYLDDTTKAAFAEYLDGSHQETIEPADETGLYPVNYVSEIHYYWAVEGGYDGGYYSFADPFKNGWLADGEFIALQKDITLTEDITCQLASGTLFNFLLGDFTADKNGHSVALNTGVTVLTDKQTDIFSAAEAGYMIEEAKVEGGFTYTAVKVEVAAPIVFHDGGTYEEALTVPMIAQAGAEIYYSTDGTTFTKYTQPIEISATTTVTAYAMLLGAKSSEVTKTFTIVAKQAGPSVTDGYYNIKAGDKYVNVAGRKTVTLVDDNEGMPGTVIRVKATDGKVETLRSQGVDVPSYAQKAMNYVPEIVQLAVDKLHAAGAGELLGEHGLDAIMTKFNESFDYNLYLEGENNIYRIYGKTPSMKPVVDFYAENKDNVDAKLPQLEAFINSAIAKVLEKTGGRGASILVDFDLETVWQKMGGTLTKPTDEASTAKFYEEVLTSEANVWNFAYQTAMIYWGNLKNNETFKNNLDKLGDYAKYIDKVENIQPNFKYYIVPSASGVDFISEGNVAITDKDPSVAWTMGECTEFKVNFDVELNHTVYSTNGGVQDEYKEYYTTLYTDFAYTLPDDGSVKAYKVVHVNDTTGVAIRKEITGTIPAQTPVMLVSSNEGAQALTLSTEDGTPVTGNLLVGADELINQYQLKTSQVESLFKLAKDVIGESAYNEYLSKYEHLMLTNAGTVNNKYFFGLSDEDIAKCVVKNENNEQDCVIRSLSTGDEKIGFYNNWTAGANKGFLVTSDFNPVKLSLVGDVDRDGKISISDVTALVNIILGKATYPKDNDKYDFEAAEVDGDKKISISDVTKLVNMILGKE